MLGGTVKKCPHCGVPIEREEGCAQMMCRRCRHTFCWYCLASLDVSVRGERGGGWEREEGREMGLRDGRGDAGDCGRGRGGWVWGGRCTWFGGEGEKEVLILDREW